VFAQPALAADDHRMVGASIGCKTKEEKSRLTHFLVDNDKEAFPKVATTAMLIGNCKIFNEGDAVYLSDTAIFSGLVCVRPRGETECFWTNLENYK
jgi:hypothetical protein